MHLVDKDVETRGSRDLATATTSPDPTRGASSPHSCAGCGAPGKHAPPSPRDLGFMGSSHTAIREGDHLLVLPASPLPSPPRPHSLSPPLPLPPVPGPASHRALPPAFPTRVLGKHLLNALEPQSTVSRLGQSPCPLRGPPKSPHGHWTPRMPASTRAGVAFSPFQGCKGTGA